MKQAESSAGSTLVAHSTHPTGVYIVNLLPFISLPSHVSIVKLTTRFKNRPDSVKWEDCGIFVERSHDDQTELWTFAPLDTILRAILPIADPERSRSILRAEIEESDDDRRVLSWLLRQHFEAYVNSFEDAGLCLEGNKSHRTYFVGQDAKNRLVVWDSPQKRGNRREVVKQRSEERPWFENEGFGYDVVYMTGKWCIRIKPFYMFTGADARTPLPAFARTAKATRRMKWDKNKNVEADLVFWSTFLARNGSTMNLVSLPGYDLLVDCAYLTLEVAEHK